MSLSPPITSPASKPLLSTPAAAGPVRLPSLTGLRWLAAFMVWGYHLGIVKPAHNDILAPFFQAVHHGGIGVSFFFVLSGFVLVWSFRPGDTTRAFLQRRFAKIYPNYAFSLISALVIIALTGGIISGWSLLGNVLLVNSWFLGTGFPNAVNLVAWTLCCEAFFYVSLPYVLPRLQRLTTEQLYAWLAVLPILALIVNTAAAQLLTAEAATRFGFFPPTRYHEFLVGVIVGVLFLRGKWAGPGLWPSTALAVVTYVVHSWADVSVVVPVVFAALIAAAAKTDIDGRWSPWRWRPVVILGEVSYAFYLMHFLVMTTAVDVIQRLGRESHWFGEQPLLGGAGLFFAGTMVLTLLISFPMYYGLERPMMRALGPKKR
ncbi:MAG TPA: acyltransferase [Actinoplanes sp.]|nr:acyltransferase [Actinoplanes sp.]